MRGKLILLHRHWVATEESDEPRIFEGPGGFPILQSFGQIVSFVYATCYYERNKRLVEYIIPHELIWVMLDNYVLTGFPVTDAKVTIMSIQ